MIKEKMQADQLTALKSGDKPTLDVLRYILAQLKNKEIEKKGELTDEEVVSLVRKQVKELNESIEAFTKGARTELAAASEEQKRILSAYLPAEISDEELEAEIKKVIEQNQEQYQKDPKTIIGLCMRELKSKAEPSRIMKTLTRLTS
jgi:uncharacterized protein YqeY